MEPRAPRRRSSQRPAPAAESRSPRASKSRELVEARTGGREQHDLARRGRRARRRERRARACRQSASRFRRRRRPPPARRLSAGRPRRSGRRPRARSRDVLAQRGEVLALALPAKDQVHARSRSKERSATSVLATLVALESFTNRHAADASRPPPGGGRRRRTARKPSAHRILSGQAACQRTPPRPPSRSRRCAPAQAQFADARAAAAHPTRAHPPAQSSPPPDRCQSTPAARSPPRSSTSSASGATAKSSLPWRAKISSFACR